MHPLIWGIAAVATAGVIARPFGVPEAVWAVAGAALLVLLGLLPAAAAWAAVLRGSDVYLFLAGMMLLAETARANRLFDWLAAHAARRARGSASRLFLLVYAVGTVVTVFLSNDATAVVLTPAVAAAARAAKADPLPHLFVCAFIANAASFVLPISNPANLVIFHSQMPPLPLWLGRFWLPSLISIVATFLMLRLTQRHALAQAVARDVAVPSLSRGGRAAGIGLLATACVLGSASLWGARLGLPTALAGLATAALSRARPATLARQISWSVLPLVAGLFVLVEALRRTGLIATLATALHGAPAFAAGALAALACNLTNNLPAGLIASMASQAGHVPPRVTDALLIGVDLGPNLSVTGSLATILWLTALRREGVEVSGWRFLRLGVLVMPPALALGLLTIK